MTVRVERATTLEPAYGLLDRAFGSRGELERRSVLERWLAVGTRRRGELELAYWLYLATRDGEPVGARDCHLVVDRAAGLTVLYLAHIVVVPPHRRRGIGTELREVPVAAARAAHPEHELVVAGEMEHPVMSDRESIVRLVAYRRAGYRAVSPKAMPYWQPDFREPSAIDTPEPVPLLCIVDRDQASLPKHLAEAVLDALYAVFADHCAEEHLSVTREDTRAALHAWPGSEVPLVPLPASIDDHEAIAALAPPQP
jgi:GNAT superfamily N-acetyltransferase